jgi:hypothetical protein
MFRWTRLATLAAVAAVLAMATGVAGATSKPGSAAAAGSQMPSAGKITTAAAHRAALLNAANLRTRAGAARYLRAIGVNPHHFVIQRGIRNYAGAKCPGAGWSCTSTAHPVIQIASAGGFNTFQCATASCAVVQATTAAPASPKPATNKATCVKTTGPTQSCVINQTSATANNVAIVVETNNLSGLTQTALSTAQITQQATGGSNANTACVLQNINVNGSTTAKKGAAVNVTLNAHQSVSISQDSVAGSNTIQAARPSDDCGAAGSALTQTQTLTSGATGSGSITQNENNADSNPASCLDSGPNVCLDIAQNSTSGANTSAFTQTNTLTAIASTTPTGPVSQTQSSPNGGLLATVNQFSHGVSTSVATQTETQCEHAQTSGVVNTANCVTTAPQVNPLSQVQYGPLRKGAGPSTQGDNSGDTFTINQSSTQNNDTGLGQTNTVQGDCSTSGNCTVTQTTNVDGQTQTNTQSGPVVATSINCTGTSCETPTITFDGSPETGPPPATLGPYTMTAFGADPQPLGSVNGVTDPAGTIGFTPAMNHDRIGEGWATWSNSYAGDVYDTCFSINFETDPPTCSGASPTQATITLPSGTTAFYFYAEPNQFQVLTIQATAQDGTTSGPVSVDGNGGAKYFGFYGTGGATISTITVTTPDTLGFAIGEFGISPAAVVIL